MAHGRAHHQTTPMGRQRLSIRLLLALWVWAIWGLPFAHALHHDLDHVHGPFGHVARVDWSEVFFGHHHEPGHVHGHGDVHAPDVHAHERATNGDSGDAARTTPRKPRHDPRHGEGSAEHLDVWFQPTSVTVLPARASCELIPQPSWLPRQAEQGRAAQGVDGPRAPPT